MRDQEFARGARVIPLSVLDLSPVTTVTPGSGALRNSLDLAKLADRLGYTRYWLAEHHNLASIASSAPDIMMGQIAAATTHLRVGSGGVMLVNHAPLMVAVDAEQRGASVLVRIASEVTPEQLVELATARAAGREHRRVSLSVAGTHRSISAMEQVALSRFAALIGRSLPSRYQ